jgi:hypothetical protein
MSQRHHGSGNKEGESQTKGSHNQDHCTQGSGPCKHCKASRNGINCSRLSSGIILSANCCCM